MNLTPEQKATGKANFQAAIGNKLVRQEFLLKGAADGVHSGGGLGAMYYGYGDVKGDRLRVGVIGTGDEGSVLIGAINPEYIEVKSIADVRPYNQHRAFHGDHYSAGALKVRPGLIEKYRWGSESDARKHVKVYEQYQELIDNAKDDQIEAVIIALPLHLHCPATIAAMKAGLHVLTEKLMGHSVVECKEMARAAKEMHKHLATGHQRHYNILYDNAVKLIGGDWLGDLHYIRAQWHRGNLPGTDSWRKPMPPEIKADDDKAKEIEKKLGANREKLKAYEKKKDTKNILKYRALVKQIKAQLDDKILAETAKDFGYEDMDVKDANGKVVYRRPAAEELIRWRLWDRTGGGLMAELGSHQLDAASIFIAAVHGGEKQYPLSVAAASNRPLFPPNREVDDHVYCLFEFPALGYHPDSAVDSRKKIGVQYASINGNGFGGYGETVFGTKGTLLLERETDAMLWKTHNVDDKLRLQRIKDKETGEMVATLTMAEKGDPKSQAIGALATDVSDRGYTEQLEHWAYCIRNNADASDPEIQPHCHPKIALGDAVIALTTNIAARQGMRVDFKKEWFDPADDATPEADLLGKDVKPDLSRYA